jgi:hypothetical protein
MSADCADQELDRLAFRVEAPLTAHLDPVTGILTLESTIQHGADARRLVRLQLTFSAAAAHGFIRLLNAVQDQLGIVLDAEVGASLPQ